MGCERPRACVCMCVCVGGSVPPRRTAAVDPGACPLVALDTRAWCVARGESSTSAVVLHTALDTPDPTWTPTMDTPTVTFSPSLEVKRAPFGERDPNSENMHFGPPSETNPIITPSPVKQSCKRRVSTPAAKEAMRSSYMVQRMWSTVLWEDVSQSSLVFGVGMSILLSVRMIQWDKVPVPAILCQGLLALLIFNTVKRIFTPPKQRSKGGRYKLISEEALQRLVTRSVTVVNTLAPLLSGEDTVRNDMQTFEGTSPRVKKPHAI
eukprot:scaffold141_cov410-Prasinococcus_capsulatus_cf.AAC.13